jgi:putative Holliday junction resolvase
VTTLADLPRTGRLVGVDYGTVRIGLAITDPTQSISSPLAIYSRRNERLDQQFFENLVRQEQVAGFVVGLPVHMSGDESRMSAEATSFGQWLRRITGLPLVWFDERHTSSMAQEIFREVKRTRKQKKKLIDKLAAQILLKNYLESDRDNPSTLRQVD